MSQVKLGNATTTFQVQSEGGAQNPLQIAFNNEFMAFANAGRTGRQIGQSVSRLAEMDGRAIRDDDGLKQQAIMELARLQQLMESDPEAFARWVQDNPEEFNQMLRNVLSFQVEIGAGNSLSDDLAAALVSTFMRMMDLPTGDDGNGGRVEYSAIVLNALDYETKVAFADLLRDLDRSDFDANRNNWHGGIYIPNVPGEGLGAKWDALVDYAAAYESRGRTTELPPEQGVLKLQAGATTNGFVLNLAGNGNTNTNTSNNNNNGEETMASSVNNNGNSGNIGQTQFDNGRDTSGMSIRARTLSILAAVYAASEQAQEDAVEALEANGDPTNLDMFKLQDIQGRKGIVEELIKGYIKESNDTAEGIARDIFG